MRTLFSVFVLLGTVAIPQANCQVTPIGPKDFAVMAWGTSPSDPDQLRGMKEVGLNISGFCRAEDLDKVRAAGLTCFVRDAWINAQTPPNLPPDNEIHEHFAQLKREIGDNPAALGFFLRDEPAAALMPGLGKLAASLREAMPGKWPYVNLFPYRVSPERLGTPDYDSYVRMLVKTIGQPFLSYDNYSLVGGEMLDSVALSVTGAGFDQLKQLRVSGISGVAVVGRQAEPQQQANAERCQGEYVYQRQHPRP